MESSENVPEIRGSYSVPGAGAGFVEERQVFTKHSEVLSLVSEHLIS